ncbi:helix-turn-helix domain-containing protein [Novosphingobium sp.]|uniref:helix-turn-helix domain-containing protein n=1 Tax=Novosphingobium sp. TaxID=1874826 RepID=UPI00263382EE|nr:helix-turn-helix transcriptional regulator [Novosphingobium sp.]
MDRAYVSALERGLRNPTVVTLYRIAEALGVPFSKLFEVPEGGSAPTDAPKERERQNRS